MMEFRKGDIVRNIYAGESNPTRYLLYLGKGTCKQGRYSHKAYNCMGFDGTKVQVFRQDNPLVLVGHMPEYDAFVLALKGLKDFKEGI